MTRAVQLLTFKNYCDDSPLEKDILECGAGVYDPEVEPLFVRFAQDGYRVHGIDRSAERLANARTYCEKAGLQVDLREADMLDLPFADDSISFVYSYNAIFHARKAAMKKMVQEMARVVKPGGLLFVNFLSIEDGGCGEGDQIGTGEFQQVHGGHTVVHAYVDDEEAETYFDGLEMIYKEKRVLRRKFEGEWRKQGYIDYIFHKE